WRWGLKLPKVLRPRSLSKIRRVGFSGIFSWFCLATFHGSYGFGVRRWEHFLFGFSRFFILLLRPGVCTRLQAPCRSFTIAGPYRAAVACARFPQQTRAA